jgi:hypothetical protein
MWQHQIDEDGLAVRRTYGYRGEAGKFFTHNGPGNPLAEEGGGGSNLAGLHVIGEHDAEGNPKRGPKKVKDTGECASLLPPL